jgi:hypothetical protein
VKSSFKRQLIYHFNASDARELETIQSLWSGYGTISRWQLINSNVSTVIVKHIANPIESNHPRGWNTKNSHVRKVKSYEVEMAWYLHYSDKTNDYCKVPKFHFTSEMGEESRVVLEDLDAAGFEVRRSQLTVQETKLCLKWLANFHGTFMNDKPNRLWNEGSYWQLETRPDELAAMDTNWLKKNAKKLDDKLRNCKYKTIIHGDAKVANFCFAPDIKSVAAVDFQYVGGGCGMKDVVYLLGSCLTEYECEQHEEELLNFYFRELRGSTKIEAFPKLEHEWRSMYAIAWADFTRFLLGWMPTHQKVNGYSLKMEQIAKSLLD